MGVRMAAIGLIIAGCFLTHTTSSDNPLNEKNFGSPFVSDIIHSILTTKLSTCNVVLLRDAYFDLHTSHYDWIWKINRSVYTMTLRDSEKTTSFFSLSKSHAVKSNGMDCLVMVIICKSVESCKFGNVTRFTTFLKQHGIIRLQRTALVYIEEETTTTTRPPAKFLTLNNKKGWNETGTATKDFSIIARLSATFQTLHSHISLIRRLANYTSEIRWLMNHKGIAPSDELYQLLTWTLNWLPGGSPLLLDIWSPSTGFWKHGNVKITIQHLKAGGLMRFALSGTKLLPFIYIESDGKALGVDAEVIHILERKLKVKSLYFEAKDRGYGRVINNSWSGSVGYVVRKEADIAMGSLNFDVSLITSDVRLSPPIFLLQASVVCERPKILPRWPMVLLPFKIIAWILTVISFVAVLVLLRIFSSVESKIVVFYTAYPPSKDWLVTFGPILQRPVNIQRLSNLISIRTLFGGWLIMTLVLSACYVNILIGKFSVPPKESPILTIKDLLDREKPWDMALTIKKYLKGSSDSVESQVLARAEDLNNVGNLDGVSADNQAYGNFMNHTRGCLVAERKRVKRIIYYFSERIGNGYRKATIHLSKETFYLGPSGWAMRGDIDFIFINSLVLYFNVYQEIGILKRTEDTFARRPQTFDEEDLKNHTALTLEVVGVTFILLGLGYCLSTLVFLIELIMKNFTQRIHKIQTKPTREIDRSSNGKSFVNKSIDQITFVSVRPRPKTSL